MSYRIELLNSASAAGEAKELLGAVQSKLGMTPNMMRTMAHSPAALKGYLALNSALAGGALGAAVGEQIALAVAQENGCEYCLSAHTVLGKHAGASAEQLTAARSAESSDPRTRAALKLAKQIVQSRGDVSDNQLHSAREAGLGDAEITEVVAHVALNVLTNYFNLVARTDVDFPRIALNL
jgi:uncharacterized peroxidase-related enzyme